MDQLIPDTVTTSCGSVALHVRGEGPTIVLLHANPGSHRNFDLVADQLATTQRVVGVDWPGYGESTVSEVSSFRGALSYRDCLDEILDALASRGWGPFVLVGSSVGGFAALGALTRRSHLVSALVLIAPGGFTKHSFATRLVCRTLGRESVARWVAAPLAHLYLRRRNDVTRRALRDAAATGRSGVQRAVFAGVWLSFTTAEHDLRHEAPPRVPTLLTWGRFDPVLVCAFDGRRAARTLGVKLHTFASGHEPYAECPEQWLAVVEPFLATVRVDGVWAPPLSQQR